MDKMPSQRNLQRILTTATLTLLAYGCIVVSAHRKSTFAFVVDNPLTTSETSGSLNSVVYRDLNSYRPPSNTHMNSQEKPSTSVSSDYQKSSSTSTAMSRSSDTSEDVSDDYDGSSDDYSDSDSSETKDKHMIYCTSELDMPFSSEVAYDAFADLTRQPTWSHWLKSVEYLDDQRTKWKMKFMGVSQSWVSVSRKLDRPNIIEWESVSGMKNYGKVEFVEDGPERTRVKMCIGLKLPRVLVMMMGGKNGSLPKMIESRMLEPTLDNFRDIVLEHDLNRVPATSAA